MLRNAFWGILLAISILLTAGTGCPGSTPPSSPTVSSFNINNGASSTSTLSVTLNNTCTGAPTQYMASESANFTGALWQAYLAGPTFELSAGGGAKTVYFKVKNAFGTSATASDSITLNQIVVPNVVEMTQAAAETAITNAGLTVGTVTEEYSDTVPEGQVISQNPIAGVSVPTGSSVAIVVSLGLNNIIGEDGGEVVSEGGAEVQVPPDELNQPIRLEVADTPDSSIRASLDEGVPYAGAVTVDATAADSKTVPDSVDATALTMTVTVPLQSPLAPGTELDVYLKGDLEGQWILLETKAIVNAGGQTATFTTNRIGTFIVREHDEYSVPMINYDTIHKSAKKANEHYVPALGYGLHRIPCYGEANQGSGAIPVILIHGVGSHEETQPSGGSAQTGKLYARWDEFVTWAQNNLDLNTYQLWLFLHNSYEPVGFAYGEPSQITPNNVQELVDEIRDNFPDSEQQFLILAHSRGGLVARTFVEKSGMAERVMAVITLATPHHGSPLAVPDWTFNTIADNFSLPLAGANLAEQVMVYNNVEWWLPGYADLAWDNFDGTSPYQHGIPDDVCNLNTILNEVWTPRHYLTSNDAGWPTDSDISDPTMPLPNNYVLNNGITRGRKSGSTLWNLNHDQGADTYINKFILYGGYIQDPLLKSAWIEHAALKVLTPFMGLFKSNEQTAPYFAANDGMVPLQSALYLKPSNSEPIYATQRPWWYFGQDVAVEPIQLDWPAINGRLRVTNDTHRRVYADFDHLDMVAGKGNLFSDIRQDLNSTIASVPTVVVGPSNINGLTVSLDISDSHDNVTSLWPATALSYRVNWGKNSGNKWSEWGADLEHTYASSGTYTIQVQAKDADGMMSPLTETEVTVTGDIIEQTIMLPGDVPLVMVWIPGGAYMMGQYLGEQDDYNWNDNENPQHHVSVPGFWIAKHELTKRQWQALMGTTPWSGELYVLADLDSPAVYVSWENAQAFLAELNSHTDLRFRLPSESEWEYACRAGSGTRFYWGDDLDCTEIDGYAWFADNSFFSNEQYAHIVGTKAKNSFGLYDMSGNVWEWCDDDYHDSYVDAPIDGSAWIESTRGAFRLVRGGSWYAPYGYCRSASRSSAESTLERSYIGFRIALNDISG